MIDIARKIHIFVDISNITCGAIEITNSSKTKLNVPGLVEIVSNQREIARKVSTCQAYIAYVHLSRPKEIYHQHRRFYHICFQLIEGCCGISATKLQSEALGMRRKAVEKSKL